MFSDCLFYLTIQFTVIYDQKEKKEKKLESEIFLGIFAWEMTQTINDQ